MAACQGTVLLFYLLPPWLPRVALVDQHLTQVSFLKARGCQASDGLFSPVVLSFPVAPLTLIT
jgi:hypothetical protein